MSQSTKIAEMLCTKFCHDITGPVGAVSNGAEFLREEMKDVQSQAADLIESASKEAVARVQYYRQAYGVGVPGSPASLTEAYTLAKNFFAYGKIKLVWEDRHTDQSGVEITHIQKKIILNLLVIGAASLIRGGTLTFEINDEKASITAKGDAIKLNPDYENCLKGNLPEEQVDSKLIQVYYTRKLCEDNGNDVSISKDTDSVTFSFKV